MLVVEDANNASLVVVARDLKDRDDKIAVVEDECNDILNINADVLVTEIDALNPDDDFGYYILPFKPPCAELEARNATDDFGLVERLRGEQNLYEGTSSVESGHYRWIMETYVGLR